MVDSLVVVTIVATLVSIVITFRCSLLFLWRFIRSWQRLHVEHLCDVLITAHIDVKEVTLAEHIHAELEKEVLSQAPFHLHTIVRTHILVSHVVGVSRGVLAVLNGLSEACSKNSLLNDLIEALLSHLHLY